MTMRNTHEPTDTPPGPDLAEGFAAHVRQWARRQGADEDAASHAGEAARALCLATLDGHVCLSLADLPGSAAARRATLLASAVVGTPAAPAAMPMIVDDEDRLYLQRHFDDEKRLAARLVQAAGAAPLPVGAVARQRLRALFAPAGGEVDWQQLAVATALTRRLCIVSGGPGTGKTSTVVKLLACLLDETPQLRIAMCAPTGKAAARLAEAVRERAAGLPEALRARLPTRASTVHRLLGSAPAMLPFDVLVVDEASMLDLGLARRLLSAVHSEARIVLLGDKDQLASVEAGAVFAEISADPGLSEAGRQTLAELCALQAADIGPAATARAGVLRDCVVWLQRNYRFAADSTLGLLAADIREARVAQALQRLREPADASLRWLDDAQADTPLWHRILAGYAGYFDSVRGADVAGISRAFAAFRVLCATHAGPHGTRAVNRQLTRHARQCSEGDAASPWYVGRPVMVLRNDPVLQLFNGDIGITLPASGAGAGLRVYFADDKGGFRAVAPTRLPLHDDAFAMSVHKAQGSEFDSLLLLLPDPPSRVLSRELLYTAVTRARANVTLCASRQALVQAIGSPSQRHSGLSSRLHEAAAPPPATTPASGHRIRRGA